MGVNENANAAVSMASTGLIIWGASVPLGLLKGMNRKGKRRRKYTGSRRRRRR